MARLELRRAADRAGSLMDAARWRSSSPSGRSARSRGAALRAAEHWRTGPPC